MNKLHKLVFSKSLKSAEWRNTTVWNNLYSNEIQKLKQEDGKNIVIFGGAEIAQQFIELHLIDELHLIINPILLGKGTPLFGEKEESRRYLSLKKTITTKMENVILCYKLIYK
jgi:dihydrofolate reductase